MNFAFFFVVQVCSIMIFKEFSSACVEKDLVVSVFLNHTLRGDMYCSEYLDLQFGSIGFRIVDNDRVNISFYEDINCSVSRRSPKSTSARLGECFVPPESAFGTEIYARISHLDSSYASDSMFSPFEPIPNALDFVASDIYEGQNCSHETSEKSNWDYDWEHSYIPMTVNYVSLGLRGVGIGQALLNSPTTIAKTCNVTHLVQFIVPSNQASLSSNKWSEMYIRRIGRDCCYLDVCEDQRCSSLVDLDYSDESYVFHCINQNSVPSVPKNGSQHAEQRLYWSPDCYGSPFIHLQSSSLCYCMGRVCRIDYLDSSNLYRLHYFRLFLDPRETYKNCMEQFGNTHVTLDTMSLQFECTQTTLNTIGDIRSYSKKGLANQIIDPGLDLFTTLPIQFMSCEHMKYMDDRDFIGLIQNRKYFYSLVAYTDPSMCYSRLTVIYGEGLGLGHNSFRGGCTEDGLFRYTYWNNSERCSEDLPFDSDYDVIKTDQENLLYFCYDDFYKEVPLAMNYACVPYFCDNIPMFQDDIVCSGHGKCINNDKCDCKVDYDGKFCDIFTASKKIEDSSFNLPLTISLGSVTLLLGFGSVLFCIVCCCFCCICCSSLILLILSTCGAVCVSYGQKKRLSRFEKLEDFDLIYQEQLLEKDKSLAHLKIDKKLFEVPFDEVVSIRCIGEGGSGAKVFLAKWKGTIVAFKCFNRKRICSSQDNFDNFESEVNLLINVNHPHIIRFFGASLKPPRVGIIMEYCDHGELLEFVLNYRENNQHYYPFHQKIRILKEIVSAFEYVHSRDVIHRDLKCENVLVDSNERGKIMDFGISRVIQQNENDKRTKRIGTDIYMAPEVLTDFYNQKVDVFSFGILCWIFLTENSQPYGSPTFGIELRVANDPSFRPNLEDLKKSLASHESEYGWISKMIERCWIHDPLVRPSFRELAQVLSKKYENSNNETKGVVGREKNEKILSLKLNVDDVEEGLEENEGKESVEHLRRELVQKDQLIEQYKKEIETLSSKLEELEIQKDT